MKRNKLGVASIFKFGGMAVTLCLSSYLFSASAMADNPRFNVNPDYVDDMMRLGPGHGEPMFNLERDREPTPLGSVGPMRDGYRFDGNFDGGGSDSPINNLADPLDTRIPMKSAQ